jgi:hydroxymethylpyrimidine pyrophosphatase-like HAD family hydrolase
VLPGGVRAVVSDLDGTIVLAGGLLSPATVSAVRALRAADIAFVPASARTPAGLAVLEPVLAEVSAVVCCNGAIGLGRSGDGLLWQESFEPGVVADLGALLAATLPGAGLASHDGVSWSLSPEYVAALAAWAPGRLHWGAQHIVPMAELGLGPASLLAVCHPELPAPRLAALLAQSGVLDGRATITFAADHVVNIAPAGVDKGTGVRRALTALGISAAEAVGFGDAPNDLPVVTAVGLFVAMANADPQVLAAAGETTGSFTQDGFAGWLRRAGLDLDLDLDLGAGQPCANQVTAPPALAPGHRG